MVSKGGPKPVGNASDVRFCTGKVPGAVPGADGGALMGALGP